MCDMYEVRMRKYPDEKEGSIRLGKLYSQLDAIELTNAVEYTFLSDWPDSFCYRASNGDFIYRARFAKLQYLMTLFLIINGLVIGEIVYNPYFHFPGGSEPFMGIIVTIAVPVEAGTPGEVLLSTILEGNYVIPTNETEYDYPPVYEQSSERTFLYEILKRKIEDFGYSGKNCLLRAICEIATISSINTNALGDIVHILLSPSTSKVEEKLKEYEEAEYFGKTSGCSKYQKSCPYSVLNAISKIKLLSVDSVI